VMSLDRAIRYFIIKADIRYSPTRSARPTSRRAISVIDDGLAAPPAYLSIRTKYCMPAICTHWGPGIEWRHLFRQNQTKAKRKFGKSENFMAQGIPCPGPAGQNTLLLLGWPTSPASVRPDPCRLARPVAALLRGAFDQPLGRVTQLPRSLELSPLNRLGIEAREIDQCCRFSPLDRFKIALSGPSAHGAPSP